MTEKLTAKIFIYKNEKIINELLKNKFNAKEIYNHFENNESLPTPTFTLRNFQIYLKRYNTITGKQKSEKKPPTIAKQHPQESEVKTFQYDPTKTDLDNIE